jgi:Pro-Pro endopeptidase
MKKIFLICVFGLLIVSFNQHGQASPHGIPLYNYQTLTLYTSIRHLHSYPLLQQLIVLPEDRFDEKEASEMIQRIGNIHPSILEKLVQENVLVKLFTGRLTDQPEFSYLKGKRPEGYSKHGPTWDEVPGIGGSKVVMAKIGHSKKGEGHGSVNLELHELAHTIDIYVFGSIRTNETYLKIWKKEAPVLFPGNSYFINYPEEYFAESFAMYYFNDESRELLKVKAPMTYQMLKNLELSTQNRFRFNFVIQ